VLTSVGLSSSRAMSASSDARNGGAAAPELVPWEGVGAADLCHSSSNMIQ